VAAQPGVVRHSGWTEVRPQSADHPGLRLLRLRTGSAPAVREQASVSVVCIMASNVYSQGTGIADARHATMWHCSNSYAHCSCLAETLSRNAAIKSTADRDRWLPLRRQPHLSSCRLRLGPRLPNRLHDINCMTFITAEQ